MSATFDHEAPTPPDRERGRPRRPRRWRPARIAAGAVAAATALLVAVPSVASALPIREQGSAAQHAPGSAANHGREVLPLMTSRLGDSDSASGCTPTTAAGARKPGGRRSSGARLAGSSQRVAGMSGRLGADEEGTLVDYLLQSLKDNAAAYAEDGGFGWVLSMLGGQQPSVDPAEIDAQFSQVDSQLSSLANAQYRDCQVIENTLNALNTNVDRTEYDNKATAMDQYIGDVVYSAQGDYNDIVNILDKAGGNINALNDTERQEIGTDVGDLLTGGHTDLPDVIGQIITLEGSSADDPSSDNMVQWYSKYLTDQYKWDPYQTHIFPAAFVNDGYAQQQFYASLLAQALFIYANVVHLDFPGHTANTQTIIDEGAKIQTAIGQWSAYFSDGPHNDGTPNWVSQNKNQGIGALPADTVLDYRVQNHPMLWTTAPVNLSTGTSSTSAPYYCGTTAQFCYAAQYPIFFFPAIGNLQLAAPSPQPLPALIDAANYDGLTGWRVPALSDWKTLAAGAGSTDGTGLGVWGPANQLPMFTPQTVTSYWAGMQSTRSVIGPMLFATGDSSHPYGVLTNAYPAGSNILLPVQSTDPSGESDQAGRLFLVQDFQPSSGPAPSSVGKHLVRPGHAPAAHTAASHPAATHAPAAHLPAVHVYNRGQAPRNDTNSTQVTTPALCGANGNDTYTVPAGTGTVQVTATGGAGAASTNDDGTTDAGGVGGSVTETFPVTPGQTLYIQVGGAAHGRVGGVGGGAPGGATNSQETGDTAGGGGGASGVSATPDCSKWLVVAGGGGGGGAGLSPGRPVTLKGGTGGNGCAMTGGTCTAPTAGTDAHDANGGAPGGMAPDNAGGAAVSGAPSGGNGSSGGQLAGGAGGSAGNDVGNGYWGGGGGGGGGAGYYGGGGGGAAGSDASGGGGGGGASFAIPGGSGISYGLGSAGQDGSVTITPLPPAPPKVSVSASASTWGQPVTLTATVEGLATGTVTFTDGGQSLGTATILGGTATLTTPATLAVGDHQIVASYSGSTSYAASQSAPVTVTVGKATPAMALTIDGESGESIDPVALTSGQSTLLMVQMPADATGSVGFYDDIHDGCEGSTAAGAKCQGEGVAPIVNGVATLSSLTVPLTDGTHYLHASWGGDGNYNPSDSNTATVIFGPASSASHHRSAKH